MKTWHYLLMSALVAVSALNAGAADDQGRTQRVDHQSGQYLFRVFCISCHGESGQGDGPVAQILKQPPPDLTRLALRAGGVFPRDAVIQTIDGRVPVVAHGRGDMPVWGQALKTTEGQDERVIRQRIEAIASHVESFQVK